MFKNCAHNCSCFPLLDLLRIFKFIMQPEMLIDMFSFCRNYSSLNDNDKMTSNKDDGYTSDDFM